jgi:hypothetical protein
VDGGFVAKRSCQFKLVQNLSEAVESEMAVCGRRWRAWQWLELHGRSLNVVTHVQAAVVPHLQPTHPNSRVRVLVHGSGVSD